MKLACGSYIGIRFSKAIEYFTIDDNDTMWNYTGGVEKVYKGAEAISEINRYLKVYKSIPKQQIVIKEQQ